MWAASSTLNAPEQAKPDDAARADQCAPGHVFSASVRIAQERSLDRVRILVRNEKKRREGRVNVSGNHRVRGTVLNQRLDVAHANVLGSIADDLTQICAVQDGDEHVAVDDGVLLDT